MRVELAQAPFNPCDGATTPSLAAERRVLRVERLDGPDAMTGLIAEWDALDSTLSPRTPFTGPLWNILWWQHLRERRAACRDDFAVHVVRDQAGTLVAVAPMMITRRPAFVFGGVRELQFFGADPNLTEMRGLVCRAEDQDAVIRALTDHLLKQPADWDWIKWASVRQGSAAYDRLERAGQLLLKRTVTGNHIELPESWDAFHAGLPRNIRKVLRKSYGALERDGQAFAFRVVSAPAAVDAALGRSFALHRARAASSVPQRDLFAVGRARDFVYAYATVLAARDQLRVFQIVIGDEVVATRVGFLLGRELYLYHAGYDPAWGSYGIMTMLVAETIRWAIANGVRVVNLSTGTDLSKTRWRPTQLVACDGVQVGPRIRAKLAFRLYSGLLHHSASTSPLGRVVALLRREVRGSSIRART